MKILVFGASGKTGQHLVSQALDNGHTVTAFTRDSMKITPQNPALKIFQGDVSNYEKVEEAIGGSEAVLSALGAAKPFIYDQKVTDGMSNIIKAMNLHQVRRLVYLSFIGVKESRKDAPIFIRYLAPKILKTEIAGHEAREKMIQQSGLDWTIVRPAALSNGAKKGKYKSGEELRTNAFIVSSSRADVADFMLRVLMDHSYIRKTPRIMR